MERPEIVRPLARWDALNRDNCIGVDRCMKACPVVAPSLTIAELNDATADGAPPAGMVLDFARQCVQCGRCDPVCPTLAGRSVMMLRLKEKMAAQGLAPSSHRRYFRLKGYDKSPLMRSAFTAATPIRWRAADPMRHRLLSPHLDKEELRHAPLLIYLGCYAFTPAPSAVQTIDLAGRLGLDYEVLAGLSTCCGWPSLLAGRTGEAERYHARLAELVARVEPEVVVSGCAECFSSLRLVKERYGMAFEPLTVPQWLLRHVDRLGLTPDGTRLTFHDSCHVSRKAGLPEPARKLLATFATIEEMPRSGAEETWCCGYWGLGANDAQLDRIHDSRFDEARATGASTMAVECVTCLESFNGRGRGGEVAVAVADVVGLVHQRTTLP